MGGDFDQCDVCGLANQTVGSPDKVIGPKGKTETCQEAWEKGRDRKLNTFLCEATKQLVQESCDCELDSPDVSSGSRNARAVVGAVLTAIYFMGL